MWSISGAHDPTQNDPVSHGPVSDDPAQIPPSANQAALLAKARKGDRTAFGQIVVLYQDRLFNALLRLVGDPEEARELTQETFTRGLDKIDTFRGDASPYTWLFRIAMNLGISQLRSVQRHRIYSLDGSRASSNGEAPPMRMRLARDSAEGPSEAVERKERQQMVLVALGRIDPEYRALLIMRDIEGFDYQQMADVLGLPIGTLKSRLFRARLAFRDELGPYLNSGKSL
ncbi:MAG: sigma-70 family RNA polymerase sigma factor [Tepidisphaeraceae bacterium]|jgi:RNA polymerase sigma-70 factor (ECF subfamily)